ncbi:MAG: hypothetical protein Q8K70_07915 [Bacteroidota bacterium]|nr:hypothetical protein [Bacteroidota bacterium]
MNKTNKYLILVLILGLFSQRANAQIKVGDNPTTINANSVLELESTNKGLLLPRVALTGTSSASPLSAHVAGMTVYNTATAGNVTPGYYFNDGNAWIRIGNAADASKWTNDPSNTRVALTNLSDGTTARTAGTEFVVTDAGRVGIGTTTPTDKLEVNGSIKLTDLPFNLYFGSSERSIGGLNTSAMLHYRSGGRHRFYGDVNSNDGATSNTYEFYMDGEPGTSTAKVVFNKQGIVGIGTTTPNANALLDVSSTNKGLLLPRVELTSTTAFAPLSAHVAGMTVFNIATAGDVTPGEYYNDGTQWIRKAGEVALPDNTVFVSSATNDPNNVTSTFDPATPQAANTMYIVDGDGSTWVWNGTAYVTKAFAVEPWLNYDTNKPATGSTQKLRHYGSIAAGGKGNLISYHTQQFVFGRGNQALATVSSYPVLFGANNVSNGSHFMYGLNNIGNGAGTYSVLLGVSNETNGARQIAIGQGNKHYNTSTYTYLFGINNEISAAAGGSNLAIGSENNVAVTGASTHNYLIGRGNQATSTSTGGNNFLFGYNNTSNNNGYALGFNNTISGPTSTTTSSLALGRSNTISTINAYTLGYNNTITGSGSFAIGKVITVNGTNSIGINAGTTAVTIDQNNVMALMGGNVGIATTAPSYTLSLGGDIARTIGMERRTTDAVGNALSVRAGGAFLGGTDRNGGNLTLMSGTSTGTGTSAIQFQTATPGATGTTDNAPTTKMTILGNGNVGIGTVAPIYKMTVNSTDAISSTFYHNTSSASPTNLWNDPFGGINIINTAANAGNDATSGIKFLMSTAGNPQAAILGIKQSTSSSGLSFWTQNANGSVLERMRINNLGNVGIGTTTPNSRLEVNGTFALTTATSGTANSVVLLSTGTFSTPAAASTNAGRIYIIRNTDATNNVTVNSVVDYGTTTAAAFTLTPSIGSIMIISDGTNWFRIQ